MILHNFNLKYDPLYKLSIMNDSWKFESVPKQQDYRFPTPNDLNK